MSAEIVEFLSSECFVNELAYQFFKEIITVPGQGWMASRCYGDGKWVETTPLIGFSSSGPCILEDHCIITISGDMGWYIWHPTIDNKEEIEEQLKARSRRK